MSNSYVSKPDALEYITQYISKKKPIFEAGTTLECSISDTWPKADPMQAETNNNMKHRCTNSSTGLMVNPTWNGDYARQPPAHEYFIAVIDDHPLALEALLIMHHKDGISWHVVLNNHSSTKPQNEGGPMFRSLKDVKDYGYVGGLWRCRINMPCSFQAGDGLLFGNEGYAQTKKGASEHACLRALAHILTAGHTRVRLMPKHWEIPIEELRARIADVLRD